MIHINDKSLCCGCSACVQICPKQCIALVADKEGFLYPQVDVESCVDCRMCENVCPELHQNKECKPSNVYAAKYSDENIRRESSSGGIFTLLADAVIDDGGVVFGARFDDEWNVIHDYTETHKGLGAFRGSKYVQSKIGDTYQQVEQFLKDGRKVLFSGTPCQIAALKKFLRKDYENLLTVDIVCHGVPSPLVWRKYLEETVTHEYMVDAVSFRNKNSGWKNYSFVLTLSKETGNGDENPISLSSVFYENAYMQAFLSNLSLRPSCYNCPAKAGKSGSDITLGDFWGIEHVRPEFDDDKGVSLVLIHTNDGYSFFKRLKLQSEKVAYNSAIASNSSIEISVPCHVNRKYFFYVFQRHGFYKAFKYAYSKKIFYVMTRKLYRYL